MTKVVHAMQVNRYAALSDKATNADTCALLNNTTDTVSLYTGLAPLVGEFHDIKREGVPVPDDQISVRLVLAQRQRELFRQIDSDVDFKASVLHAIGDPLVEDLPTAMTTTTFQPFEVSSVLSGAELSIFRYVGQTDHTANGG